MATVVAKTGYQAGEGLALLPRQEGRREPGPHGAGGGARPEGQAAEGREVRLEARGGFLYFIDKKGNVAKVKMQAPAKRKSTRRKPAAARTAARRKPARARRRRARRRARRKPARKKTARRKTARKTTARRGTARRRRKKASQGVGRRADPAVEWPGRWGRARSAGPAPSSDVRSASLWRPRAIS